MCITGVSFYTCMLTLLYKFDKKLTEPATIYLLKFKKVTLG